VSRFRPNPNFEAELRAAAVPRLVAVANAVKARVEAEKHSIMPRKSTKPVVVEVSGDEVRVANTDHGSHLDEWGSVNNPPYAPIRRSVRALGLRLSERGK
jgi:hypothetical protein